MMTAPLSQDLRERIVHAVEDGSTMRQAGRRFAVSASAAIKLMQRVPQTASATTAMTRLSGWGPKGQRLVDAAPHGHWKTTTVVAGLRASGIIAPFVLDGPMTGEAFRAYVKQVLAPELEPGDAVVMDNLSAH